MGKQSDLSCNDRWWWHLSILDVRSYLGADYDTDSCLVFAEVRKRLAVSKQATQIFDGEKINIRNQNELEFWKQYQIKISDRSTGLRTEMLARTQIGS